MRKTLEQIDAARMANRTTEGKIKNQALDWRLQREERALAIELYGLPPETPNDRYAATVGELRKWIAQGFRFRY